VRHDKNYNKNIHWLKMLKEHELSAVALQPSTENYPSDIISNILKKKFSKSPTHAIPSPEELVCMFFKWAAPLENSNSYAVLPFINGVTQPLIRIL